jgi:hypothetical protein
MVCWVYIRVFSEDRWALHQRISHTFIGILLSGMRINDVEISRERCLLWQNYFLARSLAHWHRFSRLPVSVCTTRQQTQTGVEWKGLIATAKEVISEDSATGLWRGLKLSLVLVVYPANVWSV